MYHAVCCTQGRHVSLTSRKSIPQHTLAKLLLLLFQSVLRRASPRIANKEPWFCLVSCLIHSESCSRNPHSEKRHLTTQFLVPFVKAPVKRRSKQSRLVAFGTDL